MKDPFKHGWQGRRFVLANRTDAVIYRYGADGEFEFVRRLSNPSGRKAERELVSDRAGAKASSAASGTIRHALDRVTNHHEGRAKRFAARIGRALEKARENEAFEELVLVAEPRFLGYLREALPPGMRKLVSEEIGREFKRGSDREIHAWIVNLAKERADRGNPARA